MVNRLPHDEANNDNNEYANLVAEHQARLVMPLHFGPVVVPANNPMGLQYVAEHNGAQFVILRPTTNTRTQGKKYSLQVDAIERGALRVRQTGQNSYKIGPLIGNETPHIVLSWIPHYTNIEPFKKAIQAHMQLENVVRHGPSKVFAHIIVREINPFMKHMYWYLD